MNRNAANPWHLGSLRTRLFLLVLLALLPASALLVYTSFERQQRAERRAEDNLLRLTQLAAQSHQQRIESARDLLAAVSRMPEVQSGQPVPCHERLAALRPLYPQYAGIAVVDLDGDTLCASSTVTATINVADRLYFQRAVQTRDFAVGEYQIGRNIGRPVLAFGYPVFDSGGKLSGVLLTTIELATLNQAAAAAPLPAEAVLSIVDRNGLIMVREPGAEQWIGQPLPEPELAQAIAAGGAGFVEADGADGLRRLYAYAPIAGIPNAELYVSIGLPLNVVYAEAHEVSGRSLLWALALVVLVALSTWLWSGFSILRPVRALAGAAERLQAGDLGARTGLPPGRDELSRLAGAFDEMAAALASREAAISAEREWLRVTLAGIGDAVIATDTQGRVTFMNAVAQGLTGWREADATGRPIEAIFNVIHEQTRAIVESPVLRVLRDGGIVGLANHTLLVTRDGREVPVDDSGAPIRDVSGTLLGVVLVFRDVTERRQAEAALREAKQLLDRTFASLDQAVFVVDPRSRTIISANPALERVFGYRLEDVLGRNTAFLHVDPERYEAFGRQMFAALAEGAVFQTEYEMRRQDGRVFPSEITVTDFHDGTGARVGVVSVVRDITERKQAEAALHAAKWAAEQSADRTSRLQRVTSALTPALSAAEVTREIAQQSAAALGASATAIYLVAEDGESLTLSETVGYPEPVRQAIGRLPVAGNMPAADVFRSHEPLWLGSNAELIARYPFLAATRSATRNEALAVIPLLIDQRALGVLALSFAQPRVIEPDDRAFLLTLAGQCAQALERARLYEAERVARTAAEQAAQRTARLQAVTAALSRALSPDVVADVVIELGVEAMGAWAGMLLMITPEGDHLKTLRMKGYPPSYLEQFMPMALTESLPAAEVARTGQALWLRSQAEFEERFPGLAGARLPLGFEASALVPLTFEASVLGVLALTFAVERDFTPQDRDMLTAMARAAAQAMERARLYAEAQQLNAALEARVQQRTEALEVAIEELRLTNDELQSQIRQREEAEAQLRSLSGHLHVAREEERKRIAREIHDELGGAMTSLKMEVSRMVRGAGQDPHAALSEHAASLSSLIDATIQTIRRMATELRPAILDDFGLVAALEWQLQEFQSRSGIACQLDCAVETIDLSGDAATAVFRVFQETLTNVARHAQATQVGVRIEEQSGQLLLQVRDNGRGIAQQAVIGGKSLGLLGMRERVRMLSGVLVIEGELGQGTTVLVKIPLQHQPRPDTPQFLASAGGFG
jgi:PAS domain S-box-containing protein